MESSRTYEMVIENEYYDIFPNEVFMKHVYLNLNKMKFKIKKKIAFFSCFVTN